jgi:hypothetical protein
MSYAGDEDAPGFPSNDVQLVLEGVDVALQFVKRHAVGRDMQDDVMIRHGTRERDRDRFGMAVVSGSTCSTNIPVARIAAS